MLALDPYGTRVRAGASPVPIMDLNQRYMYPQLARSRSFDSAVLGTSTVRLLDPEELARAFGGRFVNLGMNAATPWEQMELARLFLRHQPTPRLLILGLDRNWCEPDADGPAKRTTFRPFPPWLYDESQLNDLPGQFNLKSLEVAGRLLLHRLGLMPARIRADGFEVFTPSETRYDLAAARRHIHGRLEGDYAMPAPAAPPAGSGGGPIRIPAASWLAGFLGEMPATTHVILLFPPVHVAAQAAPGSDGEAVETACKEQLTRAARKAGATVLDFRLSTGLTREDGNFWDKLHVRRPVASRIVDALARGARGEAATDGSYRLLSARPGALAP